MRDDDVQASQISHHEMRQLRNEVRELTAQVHDLVEAWNTARGLVKFVKTLGSIAIAFTAIVYAWHQFASRFRS